MVRIEEMMDGVQTEFSMIKTLSSGLKDHLGGSRGNI